MGEGVGNGERYKKGEGGPPSSLSLHTHLAASQIAKAGKNLRLIFSPMMWAYGHHFIIVRSRMGHGVGERWGVGGGGEEYA